MPASIPPFQQRQIAALREQGLRVQDIAKQVRVSRHTVSRYVKHLDQGKALRKSPAASLTADEIRALRALLARVDDLDRIGVIARSLAEAHDTYTCARCGIQVTYLQGQSTVNCPRCYESLGGIADAVVQALTKAPPPAWKAAMAQEGKTADRTASADDEWWPDLE